MNNHRQQRFVDVSACAPPNQEAGDLCSVAKWFPVWCLLMLGLVFKPIAEFCLLAAVGGMAGLEEEEEKETGGMGEVSD